MAKKHFTAFKKIRRPVAEQGIMLVPLIDILTIILVFLLKAFSVTNVALKPGPSIVLPQSTALESPQRFLALDVDASGIYVEKQSVQELNNFTILNDNSRSDVLPRLHAYIKSKIDEGEIKTSKALIRADRNTPFAVIWRIMFTSQQLGIEEFENLTIKKRLKG